jgi:nucleotide-binding universal stress UspA family protein
VTTSAAKVIVVGVDGSAGAGRALQWAVDQARATGADLVAVHVLTYSAEFNRDASIGVVVPWRQRLRHHLADWTAPARASGVAVRTRLVEADTTAGGLVDAADAEGADLIVLGSHSHGGLADRILRATTYHVTHQAHQPVVVVPRAVPAAASTAVSPEAVPLT